MTKNVANGERSLQALTGSMRLSEESKSNYLIDIRIYLKHASMTADEFVASVRRHPKAFEKQFTEFLHGLQPKVSPSRIAQIRFSIQKLLELNRVNNVDWTFVSEFVPKHKRFGEDRAPTVEEVRKIVELADLRTKGVVLFLVSSGARIGAVSWLRWRDVKEVELGGKKFAQVTIYRGEPEQYTAFVTPECYSYLMEYKRYRESLGEKIGPQSFVFVTEPNRREPDPKKVRQVSVKTLKNQLGELLKTTDLRGVLESKNRYKTYEFKQAHGFRKFFKTRMEFAGAKPIITELLMGHGVGVSNSYMKPSAEELMEEDARAIPALTVLTHAEKVDVKNELKTQLLMVAGFKEEEIGKMDLSKTSDEEFQKLVRERLLGTMANNGNHQKVIPLNEVENFLTKGWEYVAALPDGKAVLKLPN
jgi:integrase